MKTTFKYLICFCSWKRRLLQKPNHQLFSWRPSLQKFRASAGDGQTFLESLHGPGDTTYSVYGNSPSLTKWQLRQHQMVVENRSLAHFFGYFSSLQLTFELHNCIRIQIDIVWSRFENDHYARHGLPPLKRPPNFCPLFRHVMIEERTQQQQSYRFCWVTFTRKTDKER